MSLPDKRDRISHRAPRLLWQQVYDDVMGDIRSGALAVDDRLPSELEMAEQYGVSRDVIRRAKEELAGQGWLIVLHGRGTFVARVCGGDAAARVRGAGGRRRPSWPTRARGMKTRRCCRRPSICSRFAPRTIQRFERLTAACAGPLAGLASLRPARPSGPSWPRSPTTPTPGGAAGACSPRRCWPPSRAPPASTTPKTR